MSEAAPPPKAPEGASTPSCPENRTLYAFRVQQTNEQRTVVVEARRACAEAEYNLQCSEAAEAKALADLLTEARL